MQITSAGASLSQCTSHIHFGFTALWGLHFEDMLWGVSKLHATVTSLHFSMYSNRPRSLALAAYKLLLLQFHCFWACSDLKGIQDAFYAGGIITSDTYRLNVCQACFHWPNCYAVTDEFSGIFLQCHVCGQHFYPVPPGFEVVIQLVILCPVQAGCLHKCHLEASVGDDMLCNYLLANRQRVLRQWPQSQHELEYTGARKQWTSGDGQGLVA